MNKDVITALFITFLLVTFIGFVSAGIWFGDDVQSGPAPPEIEGTQCLINSDCGERIDQLVCLGKEVRRLQANTICSNGWCSGSESSTTVEVCEFGCLDGACVSSICGDGIVGGTEQCDDGNNVDGDGCSSVCILEGGQCETSSDCGERIDQLVCLGKEVRRLQANPICVFNRCSALDPRCRTNYCYSSTSSTTVEVCEFGCLDGACVSSICGDGIVGGTEQCDDGNNVDGDGCSSVCEIENLDLSISLSTSKNNFDVGEQVTLTPPIQEPLLSPSKEEGFISRIVKSLKRVFHFLTFGLFRGKADSGLPFNELPIDEGSNVKDISQELNGRINYDSRNIIGQPVGDSGGGYSGGGGGISPEYLGDWSGGGANPPPANYFDNTALDQTEKQIYFDSGASYQTREQIASVSATKGYIIEFDGNPIIVEKTRLEKQARTDSSLLANHVEKINKQHIELKNKIKDELVSKGVIRTSESLPILGEYTKVFNGIALDISPQEAEEIEKIPGVKKVHVNQKVEALLMDSIPLINADDVWTLDADGNDCTISGKECLTGKGVSIAIIDTGVDYTHPDLGGCTTEEFLAGTCLKVIGGYDFYNNDNDPMDDHGHGTHVAATAAGNGVLKGVAPDAKLYTYKISDSRGYGWMNNLILAVERSIDPNDDGNFSDHVDVISLSFGGYTKNPETDPLRISVDNAIDAGVVVVAAAGNEWSGAEYQTIICPACSTKAITVGSSDKNDQISYFSAKGPNLVNYVVKPDLVAPGQGFSRSEGICAAQWDDAYSWADTDCNNDNNHVAIWGTSMATPHVSGAAALLLQKHPDWNPAQIKSALVGTAKILPPEDEISCTDTDGGINPTVKGNMSNGPYGDINDYCIANEVLVEVYCDYEGGLSHYYEYFNCSEYGGSCQSGACVDNTTELPFIPKVPPSFRPYDVYTQGAGRIDILKAVNPSILINPGVLNLGLASIYTEVLDSNFTVENVDNIRYGIRLIAEPLENVLTQETFNPPISFSENDFCLEASNNEELSFNINIASLTAGYYSAHYKVELYPDCDFSPSNNLKNITFPIGFSKLHQLKFTFVDDPTTTYHYHEWQFRLEDGSLKDYTLKDYTSNDISEYDVYTSYDEFDLLVYVREYSSQNKFNVRLFLKHIDTAVDEEIIFDVNNAEEIKSNLRDILTDKNMDVARLEVSLLSDTPNIAFWEEFYNIEWYNYQSWKVEIQSDNDLIFSDYNLIVTPIAVLEDYDYDTTQEFMVTPIINHYPFTEEDYIDSSDINNISIKVEKPFINNYDTFYRFGVTSYASSLDDNLALYVDPIITPKTIKFYFRENCLSCKYRFWGEIWDTSSYLDPWMIKEYWNGPQEVYWPGNDNLTDLSFFEEPFSLNLSTEYCIPNREWACNDGLLRGLLQDNFTKQAYFMTEPTLGKLYITLPNGNTETISQDEASGYYSNIGTWLLNCDSSSYSFPSILKDTAKFCQIGDYIINWTLKGLLKDKNLFLNAVVNYDGTNFTILSIDQGTSEPRPESKIENLGTKDINARVIMNVQRLESSTWQNYLKIIDSNYIVPAQNSLDLALIWNAQNIVINNAGNYRVYAAVVDSSGNVILDEQGNLLESSWEFDVW